MTLRCCETVLAELPEGAELIVVDDHSRDNTVALLRERLPGTRLVARTRNGGFARAANEGAAEARGAIVMFLNSDALPGSGSLRRIVAAFAADPKLGVAGARLVSESGAPRWSGGAEPNWRWLVVAAGGVAPFIPKFLRGSHRAASPETRDVDWVSGAAMAIRREAWSELGPLREDFHFYAQDLDFCIRARRAGWRVAILGDAKVMHHEGATVAGRGRLTFVPELLWPDLMLWFCDERGRNAAKVTSRMMEAAASMRARVVRMSATWRRGDARRERLAASDALSRGVRALKLQRRARSRS
jgi:GT2 family glycosyltransferase